MHLTGPSIIKAAGNKPKIIEEFIGRVNSKTTAISIARMQSPSGWSEPGQTPEFDEYTVVLKGCLRVETKSGTTEVKAGEAVITPRGQWVRYSTPRGRRGGIPGRLPPCLFSGYCSSRRVRAEEKTGPGASAFYSSFALLK